jgi:hypothetical protein
MLKRALAILAAIVVIVFCFFWFSGKHVNLKLVKAVPAIGVNTPIRVEADAPAGVKSFAASVEQDGQTATVYQDQTRSKQTTRIYSFNAGKKQAAFLKEGPAKLILKAKSNDFRGAASTFAQDIQIVLRPPTIVADGRQHYINQGGAELVMLDLGGNWTDAGVRVANYSAATFPMPGEPDNTARRFSLFPYPWDVSPQTIPLAFARNGAGTEVATTFWTKVFPKNFRESNIQLNDAELQKVVGELDPEGSGSLIDRFVRINREMRRVNAQTIYDLRNNTEKRVLWQGPFIPVRARASRISPIAAVTSITAAK